MNKLVKNLKIFFKGRKKESGSSTEDVRRNTARKQATDRGGKRRQDRTQRKHDRFKNGERFFQSFESNTILFCWNWAQFFFYTPKIMFCHYFLKKTFLQKP